MSKKKSRYKTAYQQAKEHAEIYGYIDDFSPSPTSPAFELINEYELEEQRLNRRYGPPQVTYYKPENDHACLHPTTSVTTHERPRYKIPDFVRPIGPRPKPPKHPSDCHILAFEKGPTKGCFLHSLELELAIDPFFKGSVDFWPYRQVDVKDRKKCLCAVNLPTVEPKALPTPIIQSEEPFAELPPAQSVIVERVQCASTYVEEYISYTPVLFEVQLITTPSFAVSHTPLPILVSQCGELHTMCASPASGKCTPDPTVADISLSPSIAYAKYSAADDKELCSYLGLAAYANDLVLINRTEVLAKLSVCVLAMLDSLVGPCRLFTTPGSWNSEEVRSLWAATNRAWVSTH